MDDTVQVKCTKCKGTFRERARRGSPDVHIKDAMRTARRIRKELREVQNEVRSKVTTSRHSARHAPEGRDGPDGRDA